MSFSKRIRFVLLFVTSLLISPLQAQDTQPAENPIWADACDQISPWQVSKHITVSLDKDQLTHTEGDASLKVVCSRRPGMLDEKDFNGWYRFFRALPKVKVSADDVLCFSYRYQVYEPYYPKLYMVLVDTDGTRVMFDWGPRDAKENQWYDVRLPLSSGKQQSPGKVEGLGKIRLIEIAFNYRWFRQHTDYVRWIDNLRFEHPSTQEPSQPQASNAADTPAQQGKIGNPGQKLPVDIKPMATQPTIIVEHQPTLTRDNAMSLLMQKTPDVTTNQTGQARFESFKNWNGPGDFAADIRMFWNEKGLWLATQVSDNDVVSRSLNQHDFGDCDYWRLYFDMGLESAINGANYDQNDYIFAATPTSTRNKPLINSVNYGGFVHAMYDEGRIFDVHTIGIQSNLTDAGYQMMVHMPSDLMRGFEPRVGKQFAFTCIWGDIDQTGRDCETVWPIPERADYWRNLANGRDIVLSDEHGGAAWRLADSYINRGKPLTGYVTGVYRNLSQSNKPVQFNLTIKAVDQRGVVQAVWEKALLLTANLNSWSLNMETAKLPGGQYQMMGTITGGAWQWELMPWPVTVNGREQQEWLAQLQAQYQDIRERNKEARKQLRDIRKTVGSTVYLEPYSAVVRVMDNVLKFHFEKEQYTRAEKMLVQMEEILSVLEQRIKEPNRWAGPGWEVRRPQLGEGNMPEIADGAFMLNGQPQMLIGLMGRPVRNFHPDVIEEVGFNGITLNMQYDDVVPGKFDQPVWPEELEKQFRHDTRQYRDLGLNISHVMMSIHGASDYVKTHPVLSQATGHFLPYDIASPVLPELVHAFSKVGYPNVDRTLPDALSYCLINEPAFEALSPAGLAKYQQWLKKQYVSIGKLNQTWGRRYKNFDEIPSTRDDQSDAARYDWIVFNQTVMTDFLGLLHDVANAYDPSKKPKHVKLMSTTFRGNESTILGGVDEFAIAQHFEVIGFDGGCSPVYLDFARALDPAKPLYNSEFHVHWDDANDMRSEMFEATIRGLDGSTKWLWDPPWGAWGRMNNYPLQQPWGLLTSGLTSLDIQRLAIPLHAMSRDKAQVALLYTQPARVFNHDRYVENLKAIHESLRWSGMPVDVIHEANLLQGRGKDLKLIIMPSSAWISEQTHDALQQFADDGGHVVVVDPDTNWKEPYGKTLPALSGGNIRQVSVKEMDEEALFVASNDWLKDAGVIAPLVMTDPVRGVSHRAVTVNGTVWVYLNNTTSQALTVTLNYNGQRVHGMDRIAQEPVSSKIELQPHQIRMVQIPQ